MEKREPELSRLQNKGGGRLVGSQAFLDVRQQDFHSLHTSHENAQSHGPMHSFSDLRNCMGTQENE